MDATRLGRQFRALRLRKDVRQGDVGRAARLSRAVVSRIERGLIDNVPFGVLARTAAALGATLDVRLRWNGEQLDRLLDEAHAHLVDLVVLALRATGWEVAVEVSFSVWGERGSIDIFAFHRPSGMVLVVGIKSVVPDSQATIHGIDRKTRLAMQLAAKRGWECRGVSRLLVIGDSATARRRVARLAATYDVAFPTRGRDVRRWLRAPRDPISGLLFVAFARGTSAGSSATARQRVRRRNRPTATARSTAIAPRVSALVEWPRRTAVDAG
jgi:transcriptional regulator with XRE-family HTH domain